MNSKKSLIMISTITILSLTVAHANENHDPTALFYNSVNRDLSEIKSAIQDRFPIPDIFLDEMIDTLRIAAIGSQVPQGVKHPRDMSEEELKHYNLKQDWMARLMNLEITNTGSFQDIQLHLPGIGLNSLVLYTGEGGPSTAIPRSQINAEQAKKLAKQVMGMTSNSLQVNTTHDEVVSTDNEPVSHIALMHEAIEIIKENPELIETLVQSLRVQVQKKHNVSAE